MFWFAVYRDRSCLISGTAFNQGECNREELESIAYDARMSGWVMAFGPIEEPAPRARELSPEMAGL